MRKEVLVRRFIHGLIALAPLYFALPVELPVAPLRRWMLLMAFFIGISVFEAARLWRGITFLGLRPHEKRQIASFAWAAAGITLLLWLFPQDIASAALVGMALVDPLCGELRGIKMRRPNVMAISFAVYFGLCLVILAAVGDHGILAFAPVALAGAIVAIPSECFKIRYIDDDFLMLVLPAIVMAAVAYLL